MIPSHSGILRDFFLNAWIPVWSINEQIEIRRLGRADLKASAAGASNGAQ